MSSPEFWQNSLRYHEAHFYEMLLDSVAQGIFYVRLDGTVALMNETAAQWLKVNKQNCLLKKFWVRFPDDLFGFSLKESLTFALAQKLIYKKINGFNLEISCSFFFDGPKIEHGLLIVLRDLSEMQKLRDLCSRGERMKELGEMTARAVHEIRNALGPLRGFASLLYRDLSGQKHLQEMALTLIEGAKALETLSVRILQFARPVAIEPRSLELGAYLKKVASHVRVDPAFPPNVRLEVHVPQEPLLAPIDPDALKSCLLNLIYNSFQAMEEQGGALLVSLLKPHEHFCTIDVSDNGCGIEEELLDQIFSPFFTTKEKGNGLGLVESQKIVKAHGGQLEVRSQKGRGTTFTMTLPLKR